MTGSGTGSFATTVNAWQGAALSGAGTLINGNFMVANLTAGNWNSVALSGDVGGVSRTGVVTFANNAITNAKAAQMAALTVKANATNALANATDLAATAASGAVLRESGSALAFGTITGAGIVSAVALAGAPTTTTAAALDNTTKIATAAFVNAEINAIGQYFAPATGATVSPTAPQMLSNAFINPAAGIATLTLTLPTGTLQGQWLWVTFTQAVTALTVTATNIGTHGIASPAAATATSSFAWAWDNTAAKWNRFA